MMTEDEEKKYQELEQEFQRACETIQPQIQEKLAQAAKLINEAEKLSEEHGVPFRPQETIMFCRPSYVPASMSEKWPDLEDWSEIADAWGGGYDGWQSSQVC